jgi:hypothetical protein
MNCKKIVVCFVMSFLVTTVYAMDVFAHPPQDIQLEYDFENQMLYVTITHNTLDPNSHYIYKIEIEKNGVLYLTEEYDSQPTSDTFTYSYVVEADIGDILTATAYCSLYGSLTASLTVTGDDNPPTKPVITGPTEGEAGISYTYTAVSTDIDGDDIFYCFDWDDGTEFCSDTVESGEQVEASHIWEEEGDYVISVTAIDEYGVSSETATLRVSMPLIHQRPLLTLIEKLFNWLGQMFGKELLPRVFTL